MACGAAGASLMQRVSSPASPQLLSQAPAVSPSPAGLRGEPEGSTACRRDSAAASPTFSPPIQRRCSSGMRGKRSISARAHPAPPPLAVSREVAEEGQWEEEERGGGEGGRVEEEPSGRADGRRGEAESVRGGGGGG